MKKLPKEFKKKWIKALRSGEYKQGKGHLKSRSKYCCLGVAASICGIEKMKGYDVIDYELLTQVTCEVPTILIGPVSINKIVDKLTDMNDNEHKNFNEIADWVEENL